MAYTTGGTIEASDFNDLVSNINDIFGVGFGDSGYGGNSINVPIVGDIPDVSTKGGIDNQEWLDIRNAFDDCAEHQGTTLTDGLPTEIDIEDGDIASYFPRLNSSQNIFDITANKNNTSSDCIPGLTTITPNERNASWSSLISHEFTINFNSSDHARYFFNAGGSIRISASRTGGSATLQNTSWDTIIDGNDFIFTGIHYFALTSGALVELRPQITSSVGPYSAYGSGAYGGAYGVGNIWTLSARRDDAQGENGGNGSIIRINSTFLNGSSAEVDGTFSSTITECKYTDIFDIDSPIYSNKTDLTDGF